MPFHDSYIFFGFCVVSFKGVELDIEKVKAILEWLELTDVHEAHALKRQVKELLSKRFIQESFRPCVVLVLHLRRMVVCVCVLIATQLTRLISSTCFLYRHDGRFYYI